jgi:hypothetical protein
MPMKNCTLIILLLAFSKNVSGQHSIVPDSIAKKNGVKTAIKKRYFDDNKTVAKTYTEYYNKDGKLTKLTVYDYFVKGTSICNYFYYNSKGQIVKAKVIEYCLNDSTVEDWNYSYNSKGQLKHNFKGKIKYKYDDLGRVIERIEKTAQPSDLKTLYSYDSLGQLVSEEEYLYDSIKRKRIFRYDDKGKILKEISSHYDDRKSIPYSEYEYTYLYNEKGLVTTEYQIKTIPSYGDKLDNKIYTYEYLFY